MERILVRAEGFEGAVVTLSRGREYGLGRRSALESSIGV
jgi:hypothetical protein